MYILLCRGKVCGCFIGLVDVVYDSVYMILYSARWKN